MKTGRVLAVLVTLALLSSTASYAVDIGSNITIDDGYGIGTGNWWGQQEDNEVEPGVQVWGQAYDLEGFTADGSTLTMVSGYNHNSPPRTDMDPGDLFIAIDGMGDPVVYGQLTGGASKAVEKNQWGYDFVYDLAFDPGGSTYSYDLYRIDETSWVQDVQYTENRRANPWRYASGGTLIASSGPLDMMMLSDFGLRDYGWVGDDLNYYNKDHYALSVDLSLLPVAGGSWYTAHYTMECGNDNLMGRGVTTVPDGGITLALLGTALIGMTATRRFMAR